MIYEILQELNANNGSNYKLDTLKKYKDNTLLARVMKMTYDKVQYTYGVRSKSINKSNSVVAEGYSGFSLEGALDVLENEFATRLVTGNAAIERIAEVLQNLPENDQYVIERVLGRDLKIGMGTRQINKVFKGLIEKPVYMRCGTYSEKAAKNIKFPAIVQMKADGTYREFKVDNGEVTSVSRSGQPDEFPLINEQMKDFPNGRYMGELTLVTIDGADRFTGNGLINSDNPPHDDIIFQVWDYVTEDEYALARLKDKKNPCKTPYEDRFRQLNDILYTGLENKNKNIALIPYEIVTDLKSALARTSEWMNEGYEGSILKDLSGVFENRTSKQQLKLKLEIDCEMRFTEFVAGNKGSKNEAYFSAIKFENDEGTIKGRIGVTSMTETQRDWFHTHRDEVIGQVASIQFNDLSKAKGHDYYSLSHPRFIELRGHEKNETDTLNKVFELREMAMELS